MKKTILLSAFLCISGLLFPQYKINSFIHPDTIRFDTFMAAGLSPTPVSGELNSANWRFEGFSDGNTQFGGVYNTGDYSRGTSTGGVTNGGIYAFDNGVTGNMLGIQPTGDDFTPGKITLKIQNNTTQIIKDLTVSYDFWFLNNEDRASSFNFYYSTDDTTYVQDTTVNATSLEVSDTMGWESFSKISTLKNINIAAGDLIYFQWRSNDVSGSGLHDEIGLDNLIIEAEASNGFPTAEVQFIHNSADPMLDQVDVYFDDSLMIDNFTFRTSTDYLMMDAHDSVDVSIAASNSTDSSSAHWKGTLYLDDGEKYVAIINGLMGTGFTPSATARPLDLFLHAGKTHATNIGNTDILFFNGSTDVGPLDVVETSVPAGTVIDNIDYAEFDGYNEYLTDNYAISLEDSTSSTVLYTFTLDLLNKALVDSAIVALTSGFHNPGINNSGADFDVMYAPAQGGNLISLLSNITSLEELNPNVELKIYPNPVKDYLSIETELKAAEIAIYTMDGREVFAKKMDNERESINISTLPKGIFLLKLSNDKGAWNKVFVRK